MGLQSAKATVINQLSAWNQSIHQKAVNVPEKTLNQAKGAIGAFAFTSLAYNIYSGDSSYLSNVLPVAAMFVIKVGVDYVQAAKIANARSFEALKSKIQGAIVKQARELNPEWANKSDKEIIDLVQQSSYLTLPIERHMDHLAKLAEGVFKGADAINEAAKSYLNNSSLKPLEKVETNPPCFLQTSSS